MPRVAPRRDIKDGDLLGREPLEEPEDHALAPLLVLSWRRPRFDLGDIWQARDDIITAACRQSEVNHVLPCVALARVKPLDRIVAPDLPRRAVVLRAP